MRLGLCIIEPAVGAVEAVHCMCMIRLRAFGHGWCWPVHLTPGMPGGLLMAAAVSRWGSIAFFEAG